MAIMGLTDRPVLRRDGKIRSGYKDDKNNNKLVNTPHFLLHDAPQLIPVLSENPTEIYFTLYSDNPAEVVQDDLRWYNKSQLVCRSMHYAPDELGRPMGSVAAFFAIGQEVAGLKQQPFPGMQNSRVRQCSYKTCPEYMQGNCSEHMFLNMVIPQYSMSSVFTLDTTSINAVLNTVGTLQKAVRGNRGGKLSGEIFRLYKKDAEIKYTDLKAGKIYKRMAPVVHVDAVDFAQYEAKFRTEISDDAWQTLLEWRGSFFSFSAPARQAELAMAQAVPMLEGAEEETYQEPAQIAGSVVSNADADEQEVLKRAEDPVAAPLFAELATLLGKENTPAVRIATAKAKNTTQQLVSYLQDRIKAEKKKNKMTSPPSGAIEATVVNASAKTAQAPAAGAESPLF